MALASNVRHTLLAMSVLAGKQTSCEALDDAPLTNLTELRNLLGISVSYLEQLFRRLREADLVVSHRGPAGGYRLRRCADQVTLASVVRAVETDRRRTGRAPARLSSQINAHIEVWLDKMTLADVASTLVLGGEEMDQPLLGPALIS
ncbi:MAG: Rrf2 family transcriptional regulator [Gammaproteobacteria bacterium]|jgi:Rrf2 family transcriptional regulator, iron-sulfur cluster assembly transcription factor